MLKEIAFTPHIFDEESNIDNADWPNQLRILGERMFPWNSPSPFVVSNLYDGSWESQAGMYIRQLSPNVKPIAQSMLTKLKDVLVSRPACGDWPGDEETKWANEAIKFIGKEAGIDKLVTSSHCENISDKTEAGVHSIIDVSKNGFWSKLISSGDVPMIIRKQIEKLKLICLHASYIAISSAYITGGTDDETRFVREMIKFIANRPKEYVESVVDIHCYIKKEQNANDKIIENIKRTFRRFVSDRLCIKLFFWPKEFVRDRILLAGDATSVNGKPRFKVRWAIFMGHIARPKEHSDADITHWSLLDAKEMNHRYKRWYQTDPRLGPIVLERQE